MLRLRPVLHRRALRVLPLRAAPDTGVPPSRPEPPTGFPLSPDPRGSGWSRVGLHVLLAGLPLLSISAHVFGLVPMQLAAALLVIPLATTLAVLTAFAPHPGDRVIAHGLAWGVVACVVYDVFRLDTVYMLGLWGDFIPTMGTWITGRPDDLAGGAVVGYLWRYIGDGGGIGLTFFVVASVFGLHRLPRTQVVLAAVGFAVAPVWTGLIGTVALAPRGEELMFPLNPTTVTLSLIGHLIFGLVLGLGFWHSRGVQAHWPWPPLRLPVRIRSASGTAPAASVPQASVPPTPALSGLASAAPASPASAPPASAPPVTVASAPSVPVSPVPVSPAPVSQASVSQAPRLSGSGTPGSRASGSGLPASLPHRPAGPHPVPSASEAAAPARAFVPRQRTSSTPPAAQTLDPDTWAQWRRRLETTQPGRRAHGGRPTVEPAQRGPA